VVLHCQTEADVGDCGWLSHATLASLAELNEESLQLLAEQAPHSPGDLALQQLALRWGALDAAQRARAGACPYLLLDADFAEPQRWRGAAHAESAHPFFTLPSAQPLAQAIFAFAWHLSRCQPAAARLLFAMPAAGAAYLAERTLREARALAHAHLSRLRPRWWQRPGFWRALLAAAAAEDAAALERVRVHGQTLLAAGLHRGLRVPLVPVARLPGPAPAGADARPAA
jgi:hypothetical protein